jgi:hypothetical protein
MTPSPTKFLTDAETARLVEEVLTAAGPDGLAEDEIVKALGAVHELVVAEAMMRLWRAGGITFGWYEDTQDLGPTRVERQPRRYLTVGDQYVVGGGPQ